MSSRYIKGITQSEKLLNSVQELKEQLKYQRMETHRNNKHLKMLNDIAKTVHEDKLVELEKEITKMKNDQKWLDTSEKPGIDTNPEHLMRKLDVI